MRVQRQLTVNLSKTKVVVFEARYSHVADFLLNSAVVETLHRESMLSRSMLSNTTPAVNLPV